MPSLGSIGPVTVGLDAVPCADALETLVESITTRVDKVIITATATRVEMCIRDRRMHGYWVLYEACLQLRGEAAERQIEKHEVAVVSNGGGPIAGCMLLTR